MIGNRYMCLNFCYLKEEKPINHRSKNPHKKEGPNINHHICAKEVRLIASDGKMMGVVSLEEALSMAAKSNLDLVEISPKAIPPVCKILDYGKYKYEAQKKASIAKKNQKIVELKEIQLRPLIEKNDYEVKLKRAKNFLHAGHKMKVTLRFRGREMAHQEIGINLLSRFQKDLEDSATVDVAPSKEGRQILMILSPQSKPC